MEKKQSKKILPQKTAEVVRKLRLMDDDLMSMVFGENIEATEYLLNVILNRNDLKILKVIGQREYKNPKIKGRKIRIDVYAKDNKGKVYDIEIQREDKGAGFQRARYHSSMIDVRMLKAGQEFDEIHDSYVIFITENDVIGDGLPVYHIDRIIQENGNMFNDGSHIVFVNGSYRNNDAIGRLMHDFSCNNAKDMFSELLAGHVSYYKETEGGLKKMCKLIEELAEEYGNEIGEMRAKEANENAAIRMLKDGKLSVEDIAKYSSLPVEAIKELQMNLMTIS